ncbi:MAG TPA: DsbA family oxidoreductase [Drouetiella sp.]|jgi:predicted DsbA family dithiol-disulfide isomerase
MMSAQKEASIHLDIYSDVICPWCFVGKARLDAALKIIGQSVKISSAWKPFELNPTMPSQGVDRKEYMLKKFGTSDISAMQKRLTDAGAEDGVRFDFAAMKRVPNTFNAHRLLWWSKKEDKQHHLSEVLFRAYFLEGKDIGDIEVLTAAAQEAGLDAAESRKFLSSEQGTTEVREEENAGRLLGISAVPTFVLNGEIIASGAIPASELASLLKDAATVTVP